jgi:hypothetical protein
VSSSLNVRCYGPQKKSVFLAKDCLGTGPTSVADRFQYELIGVSGAFFFVLAREGTVNLKLDHHHSALALDVADDFIVGSGQL